MRHLISIVALLAVFFWAGPGSVRHVSAHSVLIVASDEYRKVSKEESQAEAMAKRRYDNFMKIYNKIWSLFGSIHDDFTGTPGDPKFAMLTSCLQGYETHRRHAFKMEGDIFRFWRFQAGYIQPSRLDMLTPAAHGLKSEFTWNEFTLLDLDWLKQKAQQVTTNAEAAKQAMEQSCAARDRAKADSMAQQSKEAATAAINNYKLMRDRWPYIKETRDKYRDLREDLLFMENFAKKYRGTVQKAEKAKKALLKELGDYRGISRYFETKRSRFNGLQQTLNTHYMEFKVLALPYKYNAWAKSSLSNVQKALKRVNAISTRIPKDMDDVRDNELPLPPTGVYDRFIGVKKNLDTFFSTVDEIQKMGQEAKGAAEAALNNAKKAKACADKLPKDHGCPSSWNRCGNHCCPPDVPCWNYEAIERAVRAGRCR